MPRLSHTCPECSNGTYRITKKGYDPGQVRCPECELKARDRAIKALKQQGGSVAATQDFTRATLRAIFNVLSLEQQEHVEEEIGERIDRALPKSIQEI